MSNRSAELARDAPLEIDRRRVPPGVRTDASGPWKPAARRAMPNWRPDGVTCQPEAVRGPPLPAAAAGSAGTAVSASATSRRGTRERNVIVRGQPARGTIDAVSDKGSDPSSRAIVSRRMAIASPQAEASSATSRPPRHARRLLPAAVTVVGVAVLLELVYDRFLNYDARYALVWARDLARGLKPDYEADFAPTPHPLETVASVLVTPFHTGADTLLVWVMLLCFGAVVWLTYRLGAVLFTPWAG